jgi:hypothetical protein
MCARDGCLKAENNVGYGYRFALKELIRLVGLLRGKLQSLKIVLLRLLV